MGLGVVLHRSCVLRAERRRRKLGAARGLPLRVCSSWGSWQVPSGHSLPAGTTLGRHSPEPSLVTQHQPQAPKQGLFLCRTQEWWGEEPRPDRHRGERGLQSSPRDLPLLHPSFLPPTWKGHKQLVQEKGRFISINTPALTHTLSPTSTHGQMDER